MIRSYFGKYTPGVYLIRDSGLLDVNMTFPGLLSSEIFSVFLLVPNESKPTELVLRTLNAYLYHLSYFISVVIGRPYLDRTYLESIIVL